MLAQKYRPVMFGDVVAQDSAVKLLRAVSQNRDSVCRSMLLYGEYGTGKTSLARVFGRSLRCESFLKTGEVCGKCEVCRKIDSVGTGYYEYDSSITGNVESIRNMSSMIDLTVSDWRAIVFDEIHVASKQAQSALLKLIEEGSPKTFFIFVTTAPDKVLKTIHSRSLPVEFNAIQLDDMVQYLKKVCILEDQDVSDDILKRISFKANGHMRDALMLLESYFTSHEAVNLPTDDIAKYIAYCAMGGKEQAYLLIDKLVKYSVVDLGRGINFVVKELVRTVALGDGMYKGIANKIGTRIYKIFRLICESWVQESFKNEYLLISFLYTFVDLCSRI